MGALIVLQQMQGRTSNIPAWLVLGLLSVGIVAIYLCVSKLDPRRGAK